MHDFLLECIELRLGLRGGGRFDTFARIEQILVAVQYGQVVGSYGNHGQVCRPRRSSLWEIGGTQARRTLVLRLEHVVVQSQGLDILVLLLETVSQLNAETVRGENVIHTF